MADKITFVDKELSAIGVPFEFGGWTQTVQYPYFIGEMPSAPEIDTENGKETSTLIITGFHRGDTKDRLEEYKELIKRHFYYGVRKMLGNNAIDVSFGGSFYVPTGEEDLHKIQINLNITEWKVY